MNFQNSRHFIPGTFWDTGVKMLFTKQNLKSPDNAIFAGYIIEAFSFSNYRAPWHYKFWNF